MFGGGNVKLEATVTIDISKTDIPFFQTLPCLSASLSVKSNCLSLSLTLSFSVVCISTRWSYPPLIICHSIPPEPNLTNRGDNWGTRGMPPHNVYQLSVWVMQRMMILRYQRPLSLQRPSAPLCLSGAPNKGLTMMSVSCQFFRPCFSRYSSQWVTELLLKIILSVFQSPNWELYIVCFVWPTSLKPNHVQVVVI